MDRLYLEVSKMLTYFTIERLKDLPLKTNSIFPEWQTDHFLQIQENSKSSSMQSLELPRIAQNVTSCDLAFLDMLLLLVMEFYRNVSIGKLEASDYQSLDKFYPLFEAILDWSCDFQAARPSKNVSCPTARY